MHGGEALTARPVLRTARLTLRPFTPADAADVERLAGAREVADTTYHIPHPYPKGGAAKWIATHQAKWDAGAGAEYAITDNRSGDLLGAIALTRAPEHERAEMGYWIALPFWGRGYCTEAGTAMLRFAFDTLGLHRVFATHFARNPSSGRVMQKLGMRHEGVQREALKKGDRFEDLVVYGIIVSDWRLRADSR